MIRRWRLSLYLQLDPSARDALGLSRLNWLLSSCIVLSVLVAILESEPLIYQGREPLFRWLDLSLSVLFIVEYLGRLWVAADNPRFMGRWQGRWSFIRSPAAIIDLLALMPFFFAFVGSEAYLLRLFRLMRIMRLARLGRFSRSLSLLAEAVMSRRYELWMSVILTGFLLLSTSTLLYVVEGGGQPEAFGSIPRAMWWSIATLTTVGYGDVYPITALGRMLGGATAVAGIGLIAMPTGILAAAFSDTLQQHKHDDLRRHHPNAPDPSGKRPPKRH